MRLSPHDFTLRQLQYFVAVVAHGGFRKAASALHVAQPSLSSQVLALENTLKSPLFDRSGKKTTLTPAGRELELLALRVLSAADLFQDNARRVADPLRASLRIGLIPTIAPYLLPAIGRGLRKSFPELTCLWIEDKTERLVASLHEGTLDLAIVALEAELSDHERIEIADDLFYAAVARQHPLAKSKQPLTRAQIATEDMLLLEEGHCLREQAIAACQAQIARNSEYAATSLASLLQMVADGRGVTFLPAMSLELEAPRHQIACLPLASPIPSRTIGAIWRRDSPLRPALLNACEVLRPIIRRCVSGPS